MKLTKEEQWKAEWMSHWGVRHDIPNVEFAIPIKVGQKFPWNRYSKNLHLENFVISKQPQFVTWLGWSPQKGLMLNRSEGLGKDKPTPGLIWLSINEQERIEALEKEKIKRLQQGNHDRFHEQDVTVIHYWEALPYPIPCGNSKYLTVKSVVNLQAENKFNFISSFPRDIQNAYFLFIGENARERHDTYFINRAYTDFYKDENLRFILGENPSPSIDIETAGLRRRQFVQSYPFTAKTGLPTELMRYIDDGYPALPKLAEKLDTQEYMVRFLAGKFKEQDYLNNIIRNKGLLPFLEGLPASWLPELYQNGQEEWTFISNVLRCLPGDFDNLKAYKPSYSLDVNFARYLGSTLKPNKADGFKWLSENSHDPVHLDDMATNMAHEIVLPALARVNAQAYVHEYHVDTLKNAILAIGIPKLKKALRTHLDNNVHDARLGFALDENYISPVEDGLWRELTAPYRVGGKTLRFLRSQIELTHEGKQLSHCVGSYGMQCEARTSCIMSIGEWKVSGNNKVWTPSSTVEIQLGYQGQETTLVKRQHYGMRNGQPPDLDRSALEEWLTKVKNKEIPINKLAIKYVKRSNRYVDQNDLPGLLGEAWKTPEAHAHRWDRWRRILGVKAPCMGDWLLSLPKEFMDLKSTDARLIEAIVDMDEEMKIAYQIELLDEEENLVGNEETEEQDTGFRM